MSIVIVRGVEYDVPVRVAAEIDWLREELRIVSDTTDVEADATDDAIQQAISAFDNLSDSQFLDREAIVERIERQGDT